MPELPEVQTTVDGLNAVVKHKIIKDVWTDIAIETPRLPHHHSTTKSAAFFATFRKNSIGATIKNAERRGKNILIHLSTKQTIWIHMKMTGHMMYGKYVFVPEKNEWVPSPTEKNEALRDPFNRFLHTVITFTNGNSLVLSDVRKFAKVTILESSAVEKALSDLGPEPLEKSFTLMLYKKQLQKKPRLAIKLALLDQGLIAGIGNIYSDEALWLSNIHPLRKVADLSPQEFALLYKSIKVVLKKGIDFGGDSTSDYRDIYGRRGSFQGRHEAYRRTGKECRKKGCKGTIVRLPFGSRNAHFCDTHQR